MLGSSFLSEWAVSGLLRPWFVFQPGCFLGDLEQPLTGPRKSLIFDGRLANDPFVGLQFPVLTRTHQPRRTWVWPNSWWARPTPPAARQTTSLLS